MADEQVAAGTLPDGVPEHTLGWGVLAWCSKYLRQPDGPNAGDRWKFSPSQVRFVLWFYAVDDRGRWLFHRGALRLPKGAGKSPFLAALCWAEFCGPVRFAGWDEQGRPIGAPEPMPWVQIAAVSKEQCKNTMIMVAAMAPKGSRLVAEYGIDLGKEVIYKPGGGRLEIITSSAHSAEGNRPSFVVGDEVQWWLASTGGHDLADTIRRNLGKRNGRLVETCNSFVPGADSIAERTWKAFVAQREGRTRGHGGILYDAAEAPGDTDLADEASLRAGLRAAYRDAAGGPDGPGWVDLDRVIAEIYDPATPPDLSRRFYLNQIIANADSWLAPHEWDGLADPTDQVDDGEPIALFFDGSKSRDASALIGVRISDGFTFAVGVWEPDPAHNTLSTINVGEVDAAVERAFDRWQVVAFFSDVREWESYAYDTWPERYRDQLLVWAVPGGHNSQPIAWDMRAHVAEFTLACEAAHAEIVDRKFTHDGSSALSRHVYNARRRPNRWGISIGKSSPDSPDKIDAAVCLVGARLVRRRVLASPEWTKRTQTKQARRGPGRVRGFG
ncbi:terminase [Actinomadura fulvescens]|uniref:Terminase n=1 Tax=Actinomadura fulvescens TaxID=46160 RepID=A0ABP6CM04_9ACTN